MFKKEINLIDCLILNFIILVQVFYFHIYNSIGKNFNILLIFIVLIFSIYLSFKFITINFISNLEIEKKFILIALLIIFFFKFFILSNAYFNYDTDFLHVLSKNTSNSAIFFDLLMISSTIFFILILDILRINFNKLFFIIFLISTLLLIVSFFNLMFSKKPEHLGWLNPFIYLFFYNDNVSSKLQHAYIYFLAVQPLIHNMYQSKKIILKIIFVLFNFFIFLFFSKLFIILFLLFIFGYNILYRSRENIILTLKLFLISVMIIIVSFFCFNYFFGKNVIMTEQLKMKFGRALLYTNIINDLDIRSIKNNSVQTYLRNKSIDEKINHFDSSSERLVRFKFCTGDGLKYKIYKYFPFVTISNKYSQGELKSEYFQNDYGNKRIFLVNCEGSLIQIYYQYVELSIFLYLFLFLLFLYFLRKKVKFVILSYILFIITSIQHLSFDNPITYFYLAFLIIKSQNNFKKIGSKTSLQN